uniref:Uncharacterized LOC100175515 n=1 Tax=Ciona intestinalis TaxID=7719 RepID=A0A1W5BLE2_CIOIN|nr:uncharacterized protein LOC100175515 [Ciona intestinalis]|eukprot:XP_026694930.1 uncharacterized protein LOC100175515 [Ciona intestinalis]
MKRRNTSKPDETKVTTGKTNVANSKSKQRKEKKAHGLATKNQLYSGVRNKIILIVGLYILAGAGFLYWHGMGKSPELPPEVEEEILGSLPQDMKDMDLPNVGPFRKKASNTLLPDNKVKQTESSKGKKSNKTGNHAPVVPETTLEETKFPNFEQKIQNELKVKNIGDKTWTEVKIRKNVNNTNVRIYTMDDFLSSRECEGLMKAHDNHMKQHDDQGPIICFSDETTMGKYLEQIKEKWTKRISSQDWTQGTRCLNASVSAQLNGKLRWSHSTSFYPGESPFSTTFETRVAEQTGLNANNGGKFQITCYPEGVGYKLHTDCTEGNTDKRDRFATILVYLNDVIEGGQTQFTELGVSITPKKGKALVWTNMDSEGHCDVTSYHQASPVIKGRKCILQRWYYYENFPALGKRYPSPPLPVRSPTTPRVACDEFTSGSCRWYDEWNYDHLIDYDARSL